MMHNNSMTPHGNLTIIRSNSRWVYDNTESTSITGAKYTKIKKHHHQKKKKKKRSN